VREVLDEFRLIETLTVGLLSTDPTLLQELFDGIIQRLHAVFPSGLNHRRNLKGFMFTDKVGTGRGRDEDFECRATPLNIDAFE
jgi:hypothetical protein